MKKKSKWWKPLSLLPISALMLLAGCEKDGVLNPKGPAAQNQYDLIVWSTTLMAIFILVMFIIFTVIVVKYREKPGMENYEPPDHHGNKWLEILWTLIPVIIVIVLTVPTVKSVYKLEEPAKKDVKPIVVHVTSANWKWIFSYPELGIETVNYLAIPEDTPIQLKMTSAGPMNSFWVPELGGQKYTMSGMNTQLYLQADQPGDYLGRSANFSGVGFTDMTFSVEAKTQAKFDEWVKKVNEHEKPLTKKQYDIILKPGHVGRMTFTGTHLQWVDHAKQNAHSSHMDMNMEEHE